MTDLMTKSYDHLRDVLGQCYDIYYNNYDTFVMSYGINNL